LINPVPTKYELGNPPRLSAIEVPATLLARADEVIE
jgi:hypothetical protein